jgi:hypothetical protein
VSRHTVGTPDKSGGYRGYLDQGEREGWGLRLPPSLVEDSAWRTYWAGVASVVVRVRPNAIVVEPGEPRGTASSERPVANAKADWSPSRSDH